MPVPVIILGGGGHASDLLSAIESQGPRQVTISDDATIVAERFIDRATLLQGTLADAFELPGEFLSAIGYPRVRRIVVDRADQSGVTWIQPVVHANASVHPTVRLQLDTVVLGNTWLSPNVEVGAPSNIAYGVTIGHDTVIGDFGAIMPSATIGGDVVLGDGVMIGSNATVLQGVKIGAGAQVGAGAVVINDVPAATTVVGVPAQPTSSSSS